mmetsp:Transcript_22602/g.69496  ORF Transcript_22602/g.69496 Transcript_22602/m.69496 type:complete len:215 (+) Transcript_22602:570-1214(+)
MAHGLGATPRQFRGAALAAAVDFAGPRETSADGRLLFLARLYSFHHALAAVRGHAQHLVLSAGRHVRRRHRRLLWRRSRPRQARPQGQEVPRRLCRHVPRVLHRRLRRLPVGAPPRVRRRHRGHRRHSHGTPRTLRPQRQPHHPPLLRLGPPNRPPALTLPRLFLTSSSSSLEKKAVLSSFYSVLLVVTSTKLRLLSSSLTFVHPRACALSSLT